MGTEDAIIILDALLEDSPIGIRDAWRVVRGHLRRRVRPPSQTEMPAAEEPITARQHFVNATDALKKGDG